MKKLRVAFDCDGVLSDFTNDILKKINRTFGQSLVESDVTQYRLGGIIKATDLEKSLFMELALSDADFYRNMAEYSGAKELINKTKEACELFVVTALPTNSGWFQGRTHWLKERGIDLHSQLVFTDAKYLVKCDILVEDNETKLQEWKNNNPDGIAILRKQPYNAARPGFLVANNCDEIWQIINKIVHGKTKNGVTLFPSGHSSSVTLESVNSLRDDIEDAIQDVMKTHKNVLAKLEG